MPAKYSVAIYGGGVGGLSAAHELAERGFAVTVYERNAAFGGKARSLSVAGSGTDGRTDLPGEHGFRFFPGFYKHVTDTMRRIPFGTNGANCRDNLVQATRILLARQGKARSDLDRPISRNAGRFPDRVLRAVRQARHPASRDRVLRHAAAGAGDELRGALPRRVRADHVLGFHRRERAVRELSQVSRAGDDPVARRDARRGEQHAHRRAHPVAAFLRHSRSGTRVRSLARAGRRTTCGSIPGERT